MLVKGILYVATYVRKHVIKYLQPLARLVRLGEHPGMHVSSPPSAVPARPGGVGVAAGLRSGADAELDPRCARGRPGAVAVDRRRRRGSGCGVPAGRGGHHQVLELVGANIGDVVRRCLGGIVGQGSARKPQRSGSSLLESTERVRTEAKRALAPGACRERLRQRFRGFVFPPGPLGTEADSLPSLGRAGGWNHKRPLLRPFVYLRT